MAKIQITNGNCVQCTNEIVERKEIERERARTKNVYIFLHTLYKQTAAPKNTDEPIETKTRRINGIAAHTNARDMSNSNVDQ